MPRIAEMARKAQPGILIVDRTVHGPYENYQTPEQRVPSVKLDVPWESCVTLGGAWGYVPNDKFKSAREVIHLLAEVVAKGGNLLLGVGPDAQGLFNETQIQRLKEIGTWLTKNGEAIYNTRAIANFRSEETFFTQGRDGKTFAIVCLKEGQPIPASITWTGNIPKEGSILTLIETGTNLKWTAEKNVIKVYLPSSIRKTDAPALAISLTTNN
jgi:alpha-L-fucosidase